jgi:hypothetical protein
MNISRAIIVYSYIIFIFIIFFLGIAETVIKSAFQTPKKEVKNYYLKTKNPTITSTFQLEYLR